MKKLHMAVNVSEKISHIKREIYGHFNEQTSRIINDGIFTGKDSRIPNSNGVRLDLINAFREIDAPLLHWPGGGVADSYHWRDGIGPQEDRRLSINRWSFATDRNHFGTHEFLGLCEEINAEPYLVMNVGSATVRETAEWLEYITFGGDSEMTRLRKKHGRESPWNLKYLCFGNEWWFYEGAAEYAGHYKRFNYFARDYGQTKIKRILRGPQHYDYKRTDQLAEYVEPGSFDAMTLYQIIPSVRDGVNDNEFKTGSSRDFTDAEYYTSLRNALTIDASITRHLGILRRKDGNLHAKIAVDEWGTWYKDEEHTLWYMYPTMRDAIIHAVVLNIFNKHAADLMLCSVAMSVNALSSLMQTRDGQLLKNTPFHVFRMYKDHQDATLVHSFAEDQYIDFEGEKLPCISHSASIKNGKMLLTIVNCALDRDFEIDCGILSGTYTACRASIIKNDIRAGNTFETPDLVNIQPYDDVVFDNNRLRMTLPGASVCSLEFS